MTKPDDRADRLRVAAAHALGDVRVGGDRGDHPGQLVAVAHRAEALALDDRGRLAALGDQAVEHLARGPGVDRAGLHEADERRDAAGRDARAVGVGAAAQVGDPVGDRARLGAASPPAAASKKSPHAGPKANSRAVSAGRP